MPDLHGPWDGSTFAQAQYYRDRGPVEPHGVMGAPAASTTAGDLALTIVGFDLTMALGRARVRGAAYERTGSAWTHAVPANTSTAGPRHDLLVLRRDLTAKTVVPVRVQGTAAASPADPALTQNEDGVWDLPLYRLVVPANSGSPVTAVDLRSWAEYRYSGPWLRGDMVRTDGSAIVNGSSTDLMLRNLTSYGNWTQHTGSNFVGRFCPVPGRYAVSGLIVTDINQTNVWEQLQLVGTVSANLGSTNRGAGFGGVGGMMTVDAPAGIIVGFRHVNSGPQGSILGGGRFECIWLRPL